jgi:very-short-patch-repair endonuclease
VFGSDALTVCNFQNLASLAAVPVSLLQTPANGTEKILARLVGIPNSAAALEAFRVAIESYQNCFREISGWFPDVQRGQPVESTVLDSQREAARIVRELGLQKQSLESVTQLAEKVERLRKAVQAVLEIFQKLFEPWPLLPPETIEQIHQAKTLFLFLVNRPQAPAELQIEALCLQANADIVAAAMSESREIQLFRERNSERIAFRDLPDVESITAQRRELRSLAGNWWRWFSSRYYKTRKATRAFLNPPFPSDEGVLTILDELEAHERRRIAFQGSPVGTLLGSMFRGIETKWQTVEPTLAWIGELKSATQMSEVTSFVQSSIRNAELLRSGVKTVEIFAQLLEQSRQELAGISPLALLAAESRTVKLQELCAALIRTEALVKGLAERIRVQANVQPHATFGELLDRIGQLQQLQHLAVGLRQHSNFAEPVVAANLQVGALGEDVAWLSELAKLGIAPKLVDAIIAGTLAAEKHLPLIQAARKFCEELTQLKKDWTKDETAPWLAPEVRADQIESALGRLIEAAGACRTQASEWTFDNHLNALQIRESLDDAHEIATATRAFVPWKEILREEPSLLAPEQIASTLDWLDQLRQHGASGNLLLWILSDETDNRVHWWQELVSRSKGLRSRVRKLQDSFALPLQDTQSATTLLTWWCETADRIARTTSALEVVESHSQSNDFTVHDLAQATASLRRAIELETSLQSWRGHLGEDATRLEVVRIQNHRQWAAVARGLSPGMGNWLAATDTTARCETLLGIEAKLVALKKAIKQTHDSLEFFGRVLGYGPFGILSLNGTPREVEQNVQAFTAKIPLLPNYAALLREQDAAKKLGLTNLVKHAENSKVSTSVLIDTFRGAVAYQQAKAVWESDDELRYFQSNEHERLRQKFQDDDEKQLKTNRRFIKTRVGNGDVTEGWKGRTASEHTEYALLQHEMSKQRRHLPIRKLVHRAGRAMQDLCPCWMMTPLAVAQFLAPDAISFDVVIMDEASQINPEDAWGAIARGKQLVVVGDQKQMPPSDFFMSALEEDESPEDEEEIDGGKSESILDASVASLLSSPLLWHYRSRQETLIAPANSFSYDNRLILFPHPHRSHPELGVRYTHIANATTTMGKVTNALEAEAVATRVRELVLREYAKPPKDRLTIGVVTMNLYQQDCVMDLLEKMRQEDRRFDLAMAAVASEQNEEPLFVRNLENIQGDERDIMILSCTYGPHTPGGTPTQRFGPLNREGGERRFNVLITRAKWRMEIFSSIHSDQVVVDGKRQGVRDFHLFLKYAESGILAERGEATGKQSDSPFETQVEAVLQRAGFQTERQVGVAGYFIDLGVKHPHHPGLFALGVECDGKTYHSSRAARDRDRLREKILKERGWKLHRIWSTDWFVNPQQAKKRLIDAVNAACR